MLVILHLLRQVPQIEVQLSYLERLDDLFMQGVVHTISKDIPIPLLLVQLKPSTALTIIFAQVFNLR